MNQPVQARFTYRDFHDVPRLLVVTLGELTILLDSPFDTDADEYSNEYTVYRMPVGFVAPDGSWAQIVDAAETRLGTVPISAITLDPTRREYLRIDDLLPLLRLVTLG